MVSVTEFAIMMVAVGLDVAGINFVKLYVGDLATNIKVGIIID
jgi:hypothetical protein